MWHIGFWWSMVLDYSFGTATLQREEVIWPGSAELSVPWIEDLHDQWVSHLNALPEDALLSANEAVGLLQTSHSST